VTLRYSHVSPRNLSSLLLLLSTACDTGGVQQRALCIRALMASNLALLRQATYEVQDGRGCACVCTWWHTGLHSCGGCMAHSHYRRLCVATKPLLYHNSQLLGRDSQGGHNRGGQGAPEAAPRGGAPEEAALIQYRSEGAMRCRLRCLNVVGLKETPPPPPPQHTPPPSRPTVRIVSALSWCSKASSPRPSTLLKFQSARSSRALGDTSRSGQHHYRREPAACSRHVAPLARIRRVPWV
jgi:hypothetical protein